MSFALLLGLTLGLGPADDAAFFADRVAPVFERRCVSCHNDAEAKGGLSLQSLAGLHKGGDSGAVIRAGQPAASSLLDAITGDKPEMPKTGPSLSVAEVAAIKQWIQSGAVWPAERILEERPQADLDWWSLKPLQRPLVPEVVEGWSRTPIDRFILRTLHDRGLAPSPEADRRTLIRRLSYDLIGLPPTPEDVAAFLTDDRPDAYERLVDQLLTSPQYGERWARHWLDVVHYGETHGYDKDQPRPNAWPYRDYVIRAFNGDKPYGRFIAEQLAGDVVAPETVDGVTALGFIAAGPWDFISHVEVPESKTDGKIARSLDRDDMVVTALNTFCSLTVQCARCHAHKFDPVSQTDYYRLQAVFAALDRADRPFDNDPDTGRRRTALLARRRMMSAGREAASAMVAILNAELQRLPKPQQVYAGVIHDGSGNFRGTGPDGGRPRVIHVLNRGDVRQPTREVGPGVPPLIPGLSATWDIGPDQPESSRRVALAEWVTHRDNPLTWRSIVNRVWQYHFGRGLVDSANDFGRMGRQPSHPELLDWLAVEFRDNGQSLKSLHRMIVTSAAYRQVSADREDGSAIDQDNTLLWRFHRRKLDAESIRDGLLFVAGRLDTTMGGPSFQDFVVEQPQHSPHYEYRLHDPNDPKSHRRSVYRFLVRSQPQPFMTTLDCADPSMSVDKRNETINPLQALALLNNGLTLAMAERFAERVDDEGTTDRADTARLLKSVARAFELALSRPPSEDELRTLVEYARQHGLANTCRVILNLNEFTFVD
ncbi:MAG: PSD1 and planctomycete cytochrome C domain-containing protein [Planctomycetaceae bacterium]|nr:PSD1 and planctomycete cytochrome C domain-containing protein [Planctomycetaceae bacterium]